MRRANFAIVDVDEFIRRFLIHVLPEFPPHSTLRPPRQWRAAWSAKNSGTPTLRPDGTLLTEPGYDAATGYLLFDPPAMPAIPEHPSRDDALAALAVLEELIEEFPFVDGVSHSVALSGILTTIARPALAVAPVHVFDKPVAGTGGSYLMDVVANLAIGTNAPPLTMTFETEENEKRLAAAALAGSPIIYLDNCSKPHWGPFLLTASSESKAQVRPLGKSDLVTVANTFTIFVVGINVEIGADMVRRTVKSRMDADMERPETRTFKRNPIAQTRADRGRYIAAALTAIRAYAAAGFPEELSPRAGYEDWSKFVRGPLVWLGKADPEESIQGMIFDDPQRQTRIDVFEALAAAGLADRPRTTANAWRQVHEILETDYRSP